MSSVTGDTRKGNSSTRRRLGFLAAGLIAALSGAPAPASANEFQINACGADRSNYSTQAFEDFATRGMLWRRACNPEGPGLRGLVTANVVRPGRVEKNSRSVFILRAPPGTSLTRFTWSGEAVRSDCRYALQLWAYGPHGPIAAIKNVEANKKCPRRNRAQAAKWGTARTYNVSGNIGGATSVVQRVVCVGERGEPYCSSRGRNYISTFTAQATVKDETPPAVSIVPDNPFTRGEWVRGVQSVTYDASDNVGVKSARAVLSVAGAEHVRSCNYAQRVPCANGLGPVDVDTKRLADGSQPLVVQARDAADNVGSSAPLTVRVDNTPPGAVAVTVDGGEVWRNQNDFNLSWANPNEGDRAPIVAAHYRLCRQTGNDCSEGRMPGSGIQSLAGPSVPAPGEWQARVWREDAAGNTQIDNASVPVTLRFDPEPPQLGFEPTAPSDPTLVSVLVEDDVSGLAGGQIEIGREGSGTWQALPTSVHGSRLVARVDDALLPAGRYLLRATANDRASNQNSTDTMLNGQPMAIALPLRSRTVLHAGVVGKRTIRRKVGRGGKRRTVRRRVTVLRKRASLAFGRSAQVGGRLQNGDGQPVAGAEVQVFSRSSIAPEQPVAVVRTDAQGRYRYRAAAGSSRMLRFVYPGTAVTLPAQREVALSVKGASTIRARPRQLRNGGAVRFIGSLRSLPAPAAGKLVELQVELSGRWQTFRTTQTGRAGTWRVRYRFRRTCGLTRYRFRARLPAEADYPYETGRTRAIRVVVRGTPCQ